MSPFLVLLLLAVAVAGLFLAREKDLWWLATGGLLATLAGLQAEWLFKALPQSFFKNLPFSPTLLANGLNQLTAIGMVLLGSVMIRGVLLLVRKRRAPKPQGD